jgi:hypothetical protein
MNALKRFWGWLLGKTSVDETPQEKVAETMKEADAIKTVKAKKPAAKKSVAAKDANAKPAAQKRGRPKKNK